MSSYNEQIAANNARLESILERIGNLSAGASYETCSLYLKNSYIYADHGRIIFYEVQDGFVTIYDGIPDGGEDFHSDNALCGSYVIVHTLEDCSVIGHINCEQIASASIDDAYVYLFKITASPGGKATIAVSDA